MNINSVSTAAYATQAMMQRQAMAQATLNRQAIERQAVKQAQTKYMAPEQIADSSVRPTGQEPVNLTSQVWRPDERFSAAHQTHQDFNLINSSTGSLDLLHKQAQTAYQAAGQHTHHMMVEQIV